MDGIDYLIRGVAFLLVGVFLYICVALYHANQAEKDCWSRGYPKMKMTIDFEYVCIGIEGAVQDRVKRGKK